MSLFRFQLASHRVWSVFLRNITSARLITIVLVLATCDILSNLNPIYLLLLFLNHCQISLVLFENISISSLFDLSFIPMTFIINFFNVPNQNPISNYILAKHNYTCLVEKDVSVTYHLMIRHSTFLHVAYIGFHLYFALEKRVLSVIRFNCFISRNNRTCFLCLYPNVDESRILQ